MTFGANIFDKIDEVLDTMVKDEPKDESSGAGVVNRADSSESKADSSESKESEEKGN